MVTIPVLEREIDKRVGRLKDLNQQLQTRAMTESERAEVESLRGELEAKQGELEQRKYLSKVEAEAIRPEASDIAKAKRQFSVRRAILGQVRNTNVDDGLEREVSQEIAKNTNETTEGVWCPVDQTRAVTTTTPSGGPGSNLIAEDHLGSQFIPLLRPSLIASQLPLTRIQAKGNLQVPRQKAGVLGKFLGETDSLSNEDAEFETVTASPKRVGALASFSYQQMLQSDPSIEGLVVSDINERLQRVVDKVILYGQSTSVTAGDTRTGYGDGTFTLAQWTGRVGATTDQFEGITHNVTPTTPVTATPTNGLETSVMDVTKLKSELDKEDIPMEGRYWVCSPALYDKLSVTLEFSSSGSQAIARNGTIRGMPTVLSNAVVHNRRKGTGRSLSDLIYVHCPSYAHVTWDAVQILTNPYADADYKAGRISVRAMAYMSSFKRYSSTSICAWYNQCITAL